MPSIGEILQSGSLAYANPSPASVAARRAIAQQLLEGSRIQNAGPFGALANTLGSGFSGYGNALAANEQTAGMEGYNDLIAKALSNPEMTDADLASLASNPWASEASNPIASALLGQAIQRRDPAYQLDIDLKRAQLARGDDPRLFQFSDRIVSIGPDGQPQEVYTAPGMSSSEPPTLTTIYDANGREQKGYMVNGENGPEFVPVGAPKAQIERPEFTVSQATAAGYADRMVQADAILDNPKLASAQTDVGQQVAAGVPFIGNFLTSAEKQQADQAQRDFINAILRRESGAVISESEFANARRQYFPQPGDTQAVLDQKAANRQNAIMGVARAAGPAYERPDTTNYLSSPTEPPTDAPQLEVGTVDSGYVYVGGPPGDPSSWEPI